MTKRELIKSIQLAESRAWQQLYADTREFGWDHQVTRATRTAWNAVYELRCDLGIPALAMSDMIAEGLI